MGERAGPGGSSWAAEPVIDLTRSGPTEAAWSAELGRRALAPWDPPSTGRLVVVAPHPDDETLGAGGLVSVTSRSGWEVTVVALSDGEAAYEQDELGAVRADEQRRSVAALTSGQGRVVRLGLADGELAAVDGLERRLAPWVEGATLVVAPWPGDGHPDHEAAGRAARLAGAAAGVAVGFVPIWAWHWQDPATADFLDGAVVVHLDAEDRARKAAALDIYRSQYGPDGRAPILPDHVLVRFRRAFEVLAW